MIDENIKWAATFREYDSERIMVAAYIEAEWQRRKAEFYYWAIEEGTETDSRLTRSDADWRAEVIRELES